MGPFIFLDIESTGLDATREQIIEIACIKWKDGKITERFESLVNPHKPVPREITQLTGIRDEDVKNAPSFEEIQETIVTFLEDLPIIGHNIAFDTGFLRQHLGEMKNVEIDTLELAKILLPKESSYALEVLMKHHNLPLRNSHRAMADTETTVSFFEFLLQKIQGFSGAAVSDIQSILKKSTWVGKPVFADMKSKSGTKELEPVDQSSLQRSKKEYPEWNTDITKKFLAGKKILLESSNSIPLSELKNNRTLVAYATKRSRDDTMNRANELGIPVCHLKEPRFYLSPKKLRDAIANTQSFGEATPFFIKMAFWASETQTGDREEISLEREEYALFDSICDEEGEDIFWKAISEKAAKSSVILIHHRGLIHGLNAQCKNCIITDASHLEDSITNAHRARYTERILHPLFTEKATVLFGLIGIFYEHFAENNFAGFKGNVILNDRVKESREWRRVLECAQNLPEHPTKAAFIKSLSGLDASAISWISSWNDEVSFQTAPRAVAELFHASIQPFSNVMLNDEALSGDSTFSLVRKLFEIDDTWETIQESSTVQNTLQLEIPDSFPAPNTDGYFKRCLTLFAEIISTQKGRALFLLSSKKSVDVFYTALAPICQEQGVKVLGVGVSGGTGKSLALFLENPSGSILLATTQIVPFLDEIENSIDTIVFQKIAFDSPEDPVCSVRGALFQNSFTGYVLPRALMKFRELLAELRKGGATTCYVLDGRMKNREYGALFF